MPDKLGVKEAVGCGYAKTGTHWDSFTFCKECAAGPFGSFDCNESRKHQHFEVKYHVV